MMQLPVQNFAALVEQMAASVQGTAGQLLDFSVGSVLRALMEACAAVALWLQWLILQVLASTRAATSQGPALDTWMADFALVRLPASAAAGAVTFMRYYAGIAATIPVGTMVLTTDGEIGFAVVAQASNSAWNGDNGYTLSATQLSVDVPIVAVAAGASGNVLANAISLVAAPIPGVDGVTNAMPLAGGVDAESDAAFRTRFQLYINSRSLATDGAVQFAIASVQQGLRYTVIENQNATGAAQPGNFCVTVDDGTGNPPDALLQEVQAAVDAVRPIGATFSVMPPLITDITVTATLETNNPITHAAVAALAQAAIESWIATLPIGGTLAVSKIAALCHAADPSVLSVVDILVNGAPTDLAGAPNGILLPTSVTVS